MGYPPGVRTAIGALLLLATPLATTGCPSSGTVPPGEAGVGDDATLGLINEADGMSTQPMTAAACSDPTHCITGTASLDPSFEFGCISPQCTTWQVDLFDTYPAGDVQPIVAPVLVASDQYGSWTFDAIAEEGGPSSGYYVQATAVFVFDGGQSVVTAVVGPVTLPATGVAINLAPLQATAYEARVTGGSMLLDWVQAHVYDPSSGAEITSGAQVSVWVDAVDGGEGGALPLTPTAFGSGTAYYAAFDPPPPAQATYTVTASHPAFGDAGYAAQLVADPPTFDGGTITSVDAGATGVVTVSWEPEPQSGYEVVELYAAEGDGGWFGTPAYASPAPDPPGQTSEVTSALDAGTYLVNVAYTRALCAIDAGGCVQASTVAASTTVVP
jgi:hypothetical protein